MEPSIRHYSDPLEGLRAQIAELRGLNRIVPPLVDADRDRRFKEIGERPSDGEDGEVIDVYSAEAGPDEGFGFADFAHAIRSSAVVFAWAVLEDFVVHELRRVDSAWDGRYGRFDDLKSRFRDVGIRLGQLAGWEHVLHAQALRNALVHNQGQYTRKYLDTKHAYRPIPEEAPYRAPGDDGLINRELIPLSADLVDNVIVELGGFATRVRAAIDEHSA